MTASEANAYPTALDGVTTSAVAAAPVAGVAPSLLTFVTPVADADLETGSCVDGVCVVDSPR